MRRSVRGEQFSNSGVGRIAGLLLLFPFRITEAYNHEAVRRAPRILLHKTAQYRRQFGGSRDAYLCRLDFPAMSGLALFTPFL
jgi:hypothetical protein